MAKKVNVNGKIKNESKGNKRLYETKKHGWRILASFRKAGFKRFETFDNTLAGNAAADAWLAQQLVEYLAVKGKEVACPNGYDPKLTVSAALTLYKQEWKACHPGEGFDYDQEKELDRLAAHPCLVNLPLGEISYKALHAYCTARRNTITVRGTRVHPSSVLREYATLRVALTTLAFWKEWPLDIPSSWRKGLRLAGLLAESTKRKVRPSPRQIDQLREILAQPVTGKGAIDLPILDIFDVAIVNAFRQGEITELRWSELKVETSQILALRKDSSVQEGRSWKITPLVPYVLEILLRQPRKPHILLGERTPGVEPGSIDDLIFPYVQNTVAQRFRAACEKIGLKGELRFHDLRHEAASQLYRLIGAKARLVTGHKTEESFFRYVNEGEVEAHEVAKAVPDLRPATLANVVPIRKVA